MARENGGNRKKYEEEIGYCKKIHEFRQGTASDSYVPVAD